MSKSFLYKESEVLDHVREYYTAYHDENWLPIPDFPGYLISDYGRIYSWRSSRLMKPSVLVGGYLQTALRKGTTSVGFGVHQLVARTFIGEPPEKGMEVNHKDGNGGNNHVSNLEWMTHLENMRHKKEVLQRPKTWRDERDKRGVTAKTSNKIVRSHRKTYSNPRIGVLADGQIGVVWDEN